MFHSFSIPLKYNSFLSLRPSFLSVTHSFLFLILSFLSIPYLSNQNGRLCQRSTCVCDRRVCVCITYRPHLSCPPPWGQRLVSGGVRCSWQQSASGWRSAEPCRYFLQLFLKVKKCKYGFSHKSGLHLRVVGSVWNKSFCIHQSFYGHILSIHDYSHWCSAHLSRLWRFTCLCCRECGICTCLCCWDCGRCTCLCCKECGRCTCLCCRECGRCTCLC